MNCEVGSFGLKGLRPRVAGWCTPSSGSGLRAALLLALLAAAPCWGQTNSGASQTPGIGQRSTLSQRTVAADMDQSLAGGSVDSIYQERRLRQLSVAQHKAMVSDTDKLVKLVNELNAEINRTYPAALTPEQNRKVAEIEKLAHSVKDKMRTSLQGTPGFLDSGQTGSPSLH